MELPLNLMQEIKTLLGDLENSSYGILLVPLFAFCEAILGLGLFVSGIFLVGTCMLIYSAQPDLLPFMLVRGFAGAFSADLIGYGAGYLFAARINRTGILNRYKKARDKFSALVDRSMLLAICAGRLTPFLRSVTPFLAGSFGLKPFRFLVFDLIACSIWVSGLATILLLLPVSSD